MEDKAKLIEAILLWRGEPVNKKKLGELVDLSVPELESALNSLDSSLKERGIVLLRKDDEVMLGTNPDASAIIEKLTREELSRELTKAALETLSIIIYMGPIRRSSIDYIRGVNSQFSIRHLEIRGLIEKVLDEKDGRVYLYRPSFDLLSHLGIKSIDELSNLDEIRSRLKEFEKSDEINEQAN